MNQIVHSKTQLDGIADKTDCSFDCNGHPNWDTKVGYYFVDVSGTRLYVSDGYPKPSGTSSTDTLVEDNFNTVMGLSDDDFVFGVGANNSLAVIPIKFEDKLAQVKSGAFKCHVEYRAPAPAYSYYVRAVTDDC